MARAQESRANLVDDYSHKLNNWFFVSQDLQLSRSTRYTLLSTSITIHDTTFELKLVTCWTFWLYASALNGQFYHDFNIVLSVVVAHQHRYMLLSTNMETEPEARVESRHFQYARGSILYQARFLKKQEFMKSFRL